MKWWPGTFEDSCFEEDLGRDFIFLETSCPLLSCGATVLFPPILFFRFHWCTYRWKPPKIFGLPASSLFFFKLSWSLEGGFCPKGTSCKWGELAGGNSTIFGMFTPTYLGIHDPNFDYWHIFHSWVGSTTNSGWTIIGISLLKMVHNPWWSLASWEGAIYPRYHSIYN